MNVTFLKSSIRPLGLPIYVAGVPRGGTRMSFKCAGAHESKLGSDRVSSDTNALLSGRHLACGRIATSNAFGAASEEILGRARLFVRLRDAFQHKDALCLACDEITDKRVFGSQEIDDWLGSAIANAQPDELWR